MEPRMPTHAADRESGRGLSPVFEHSVPSGDTRLSHFGDSQLISTWDEHQAHRDAGPDLMGRMGQAFVAAGKLTQEEVERIVQVQKRRRVRFGEAAIRLGLLSEADVHEVLAQQFNYQSMVRHGQGSRKQLSRNLAIAHQPYSPQAETIRRFRSEIMLRAGDVPCLVFSLISPNAGEGKSHLAASLAIAFSQLNLKTLLIDANLRKPTQHQLFELNNRTGLSNMLAGRTLPTMDLSHTISPFLNVLTAGPKPPNPTEILSFPSLAELIEVFRSEVKVIIVDTPSTHVGPDAQIIAPQAERAILVCRKHRTTIESMHRAFGQMETSSVQVLGSFLNEIPMELPERPAGKGWMRWLPRLRRRSASNEVV